MSVNEEVPAPPKHRLSPFEVRNTDLVSRLLAATPPYLYNMPLVPHSYFFSEMLRSLVQSKAEAAARMNNNLPHRRARKRTWTQGREFQKEKTDNQEMPPPTWTPPKERRNYDNKPLELTNKIPLNNNTMKLNETQISEPSTSRAPEFKNTEKEIPNVPIMFPPIPNQNNLPSTSNTDLILPPPPPIWYPPIYPPPYGIDPLHFFIDLRVSGHIYDRKNQGKDFMEPMVNMLDGNHPASSSSITSSSSSSSSEIITLNRESGHQSAFSVPIPSVNDPLNLTSKFHKKNDRNERKGKFDINSLFDNSENKQSSNYILKNLVKIYRDVNDTKYNHEGIDLSSRNQDVSVKEEGEKETEEKDPEKEKKCKDLRALIGLELVVDYMNHSVKPKQSISGDSSTDVSRCSSSSPVEIVSIPDV